MQIVEIDTQIEKSRTELIKYLAPHETKALFLLGNLRSNFQPSFIYVVKENSQILGVYGYYPTFQSLSVFSKSEEATRCFVKSYGKKFTISALLGMAEMAKPAYEELLALGYPPADSPEKLFFELNMKDFKPYLSKDGVIRPVEEKDVDAIVLLHRQIHQIPKENPITEEERTRVRASNVKFCLEIEGKVVSVAISNGLAIKAFQILGVSTETRYQKRGFAKAVCSHLITYMKNQGAEKAILFTGEDDIAAIKCYEALGFRITDRYYLALFQTGAL